MRCRFAVRHACRESRQYTTPSQDVQLCASGGRRVRRVCPGGMEHGSLQTTYKYIYAVFTYMQGIRGNTPSGRPFPSTRTPYTYTTSRQSYAIWHRGGQRGKKAHAATAHDVSAKGKKSAIAVPCARCCSAVFSFRWPDLGHVCGFSMPHRLPVCSLLFHLHDLSFLFPLLVGLLSSFPRPPFIPLARRSSCRGEKRQWISRSKAARWLRIACFFLRRLRAYGSSIYAVWLVSLDAMHACPSCLAMNNGQGEVVFMDQSRWHVTPDAFFFSLVVFVLFFPRLLSSLTPLRRIRTAYTSYSLSSHFASSLYFR